MSGLYKAISDFFIMIGRYIRAYFMRIVGKAKNMTGFLSRTSKKATEAVPKAISTVADISQAPTKREDYIETKSRFISKALLVRIAVAIAVIGVLGYFFIWPWFMRTFLTNHLYIEDPRVETYSGKVVLYHDAEKELPFYSGRLTEGELRGGATEQAPGGELVYSGEFAHWQYSGIGSLYQDGRLFYQGEFAFGEFSGEGVLYYENGDVLYSGNFQGGQRNGQGTEFHENGKIKYRGTFYEDFFDGSGMLYDADGALAYQGMFVAGFFEGEGTMFFPDGSVHYRGGFVRGQKSGQGWQYFGSGILEYKGGYLEDLPEGYGELWRSDGSIVYEGEFRGGRYQGDGALHMENGQVIAGRFDEGFPLGIATVSESGRPVYSGYFASFSPHGQGELYARSDGSVIYRGLMKHGVIDGAAAFGLSAAAVREMFAEAKTREVIDLNGGFSIVNESLGMTVYLSLKTEERDPEVKNIYWHALDSDTFAGLPWAGESEYRDWRGANGLGEASFHSRETAEFSAELPLAEGLYEKSVYIFADETIAFWYLEGGEEMLMIEWVNASAMLEASDTQAEKDVYAALAGFDDHLLKLLLELAEDRSFRLLESEILLRLDVSVSFEERELARGLAADYFENAGNRESLLTQLDLRKRQLADAMLNMQVGLGDEEAVRALESEIAALTVEISRSEFGAEAARLGLRGLTGYDVAAPETADAAEGQNGRATETDGALAKMLFLFNPGLLDMARVERAAADFGMHGGDDITLMIMAIELSWQECLLAMANYEATLQAASDTRQAFLTGQAERHALDEATIEAARLRIALNGVVAAFSKRAAALSAAAGDALVFE